MKSLYDSAISGAITILNDQIDDLETAKEEAVEALENARDAEIKPLEEKVKALEKEKEEMQKINEQRERELNLQKAQYDLERAQSQRNRLIYKNGQMSYVNDNAEVRSTKESLESAIFDKKVGELDDQIDALNDQIDEINEKYDKLIEQTEKFYDDQIKGLQKMVKEWEKVQHIAELAEATKALSELGLSPEDILSGNVDISAISQQYAAIVGGLEGFESAAYAAKSNASELKTTLDGMLGYKFTDMGTEQLASDLGDASKAAGDLSDSIGGAINNLVGGENTEESPNGGDTKVLNMSTKKEGKTVDSSNGTLVDAMEAVSLAANEDIKPVTEEFEKMAGNIETAKNNLVSDTEEDPNTLLGGIELLKKKGEDPLSTVAGLFKLMADSINTCVSGLKTLSKLLSGEEGAVNGESIFDTISGLFGGGTILYTGTAYANGNWSAKSKGINNTESALVGELGEELVVDSKTGTWHTVGSNGAEFSQINPNDIVFNHKQTEGLLKNGRINSRGKAYAGGKLPDNLSPVSSYSKLGSIDNLADKLEVGNQRLAAIDTNVASIVNTKTINNNPIINVNNPQFTCTGINGEEVLRQIEQSFSGLFTNAYQRSMTN